MVRTVRTGFLEGGVLTVHAFLLDQGVYRATTNSELPSCGQKMLFPVSLNGFSQFC